MEPRTNQTSTAPAPHRARRKRINYACNFCRSRKTRCDEKSPSCQACLDAGIPCVTTDKRRPGVAVERRGAGTTPDSRSPGSTSLGAPSSGPADTISRSILTAGPFAGNVSTDDAEGDHLTGEARNPGSTTRYLGRLPILSRPRGGNASQILTGWLDLALRRLSIPLGFSPASYGAAPVPTLSLSLAPPRLVPDAAERRRLLDAYMQYVHPIFPVLDTARFEPLLQAHVALDGAFSDNGAITWPSLLLFHLALELGQLHCHRPDRDSDLQYRQERQASLDFFQSVLGHLTAWGSLEAVQIAFLIALLLWCNDRVGPAWSVLGLCVSMATSQGLHLHRRRADIPATSAGPPSAASSDKGRLDAERHDTWWSIFSLEKVAAFELSRPSLIRDQDCDYTDVVVHPSWKTSGASDNCPDAFASIVSFAKVLGKISQKNLQACEREESASADQGFELVIVDKVRTIGESVLALVQWADSFPEGQRPNSDLLYASPAQYPLVAFLTAQYHMAVMVVTRNSILISDMALKHAMDTLAVSQPWAHVIQHGRSIAVTSARRIVKLLIDSADMDVVPSLATVSMPLHALYVLAISLFRSPTSRMASSDVSLFRHAVEFTRQKLNQLPSSQSEALYQLLGYLEELVGRVVVSPNGGSWSYMMSGASPSNKTPSSSMSGPQEPPLNPNVDLAPLENSDMAWLSEQMDDPCWDWAGFV